MKKYKLEITVFLCGGLTMMLELVAARVLAPYVGSSNLIWTTIIGIMLIGMSLGYWVGGKLADKNPNIKTVSEFLFIACITTSIIPISEVVIIDNLVEIFNELVIVAIISATLIFGIPSFMLAAISPMAVKIKNEEEKAVGKISGKISSLSTIGSIIGTFVAGFILIPNIGVRNIILISSILLWLMGICLYKKKNKKTVSIMIVILIAIIGINIYSYKLFQDKNPDIIKDVDSEYSRIWVKEMKNEDVNYKTLQVDTGLESYIDQNTGEMGAEYLKYFDLFDYYNENANSVLMIGGAAYTYPIHYLDKYQDKTIDVVEIDEKMTEIAQEEFGLDTNNPNLKIHHQDGRSFLNYNDTKYDAILIDAFKGLNAPFELTTYEAMQKVRNNLKDNGIVITNIISALEGEEDDFIKYEYNTYKAVFDDVKLFRVRDAEDNQTQNIILIGIKGKTSLNENESDQYQELLEREITDFESDKQVITDDYAPIGD